MGKIIEFKSEHDLDIGTILWAVGEKDVRKYKPCLACGNKRTIKVTDSGGNEYEMACPRCTGQQTKGGAYKDFKHYKTVEYVIRGFELTSNSRYEQASPTIKLHPRYSKSNDYAMRCPDITNSETLTATSRFDDKTTQFYTSEQEAKAEAKRLNGEQAAAIKKFLEGWE